MSDNIPFEIQVQIMKRLPVQSLIQFRTVSKPWKSVIDSSDFITHYNTQLHHLLLRYDSKSNQNEGKYVSVVDDDTFPKQIVSLTLPSLVKMLVFPTIIGCSHGLLCLYGHFRQSPFRGTCMAVLWNISISKAVGVVVPNVADHDTVFGTVLGFGVYGETGDPKIVKITHIEDMESSSIPDSIPWQAEVFTLSTGAWRSPYSTNLPRKSIRFGDFKVAINGVLYWLATDKITMDDEDDYFNLIIEFDMTTEEFKEVNLPDLLAYETHDEDLCIAKLRKSLVVLERDEDEKVFVVWIMEDGVPKSFTKLYTIYTPDETVLKVLEFRESGEPVIEYGSEMVYGSPLAVYDSYTEQLSDLGFHFRGSYSMYAYMETVLLLDQPNFTIYNQGKRHILM